VVAVVVVAVIVDLMGLIVAAVLVVPVVLELIRQSQVRLSLGLVEVVEVLMLTPHPHREVLAVVVVEEVITDPVELMELQTQVVAVVVLDKIQLLVEAPEVQVS
jgi:hypothetical protein